MNLSFLLFIRKKAQTSFCSQKQLVFNDTVLFNLSYGTGLSNEETLKKMARRLKGGLHIASPVFDSCTEEEIGKALTDVGLPANGQQILFDGRTGEPFKHDVCFRAIKGVDNEHQYWQVHKTVYQYGCDLYEK